MQDESGNLVPIPINSQNMFQKQNTEFQNESDILNNPYVKEDVKNALNLKNGMESNN